jgi:LysM repeat protein
MRGGQFSRHCATIQFDPGGSSMQYKTVFLSLFAAAALLTSTGCGKSKAAHAQNTPPQSLSEPIRPSDEGPAASPAIPNSNDDYAAQRPGESRELPVFKAPVQESQPMQVTAAPAEPAPVVSGGGKYHVLNKGETLYAVARKYNVKPKDLISMNQFKDPNKLAVGTKVYLPN